MRGGKGDPYQTKEANGLDAADTRVSGSSLLGALADNTPTHCVPAPSPPPQPKQPPHSDRGEYRPPSANPLGHQTTPTPASVRHEHHDPLAGRPRRCACRRRIPSYRHRCSRHGRHRRRCRRRRCRHRRRRGGSCNNDGRVAAAAAAKGRGRGGKGSELSPHPPRGGRCRRWGGRAACKRAGGSGPRRRRRRQRQHKRPPTVAAAHHCGRLAHRSREGAGGCQDAEGNGRQAPVGAGSVESQAGGPGLGWRMRRGEGGREVFSRRRTSTPCVVRVRVNVGTRSVAQRESHLHRRMLATRLHDHTRGLIVIRGPVVSGPASTRNSNPCEDEPELVWWKGRQHQRIQFTSISGRLCFAPRFCPSIIYRL